MNPNSNNPTPSTDGDMPIPSTDSTAPVTPSVELQNAHSIPTTPLPEAAPVKKKHHWVLIIIMTIISIVAIIIVLAFMIIQNITINKNTYVERNENGLHFSIPKDWKRNITTKGWASYGQLAFGSPQPIAHLIVSTGELDGMSSLDLNTPLSLTSLRSRNYKSFDVNKFAESIGCTKDIHGNKNILQSKANGSYDIFSVNIRCVNNNDTELEATAKYLVSPTQTGMIIMVGDSVYRINRAEYDSIVMEAHF